MIAREVETLGKHLSALREQAIWRLALAALAFGGALAASQVRRDLAIPLLVGGGALALLGIAAFVERECLLDEVAADRDTFTLAAVRSYGARLTASGRRHNDAESIRRLLADPELAVPERIEANRELLERLAEELDSDRLVFDPVCAVKLEHLLLRPDESALFDEHRPAEDVRSKLVQIETGLRP
jgi:hypothetical protein